MCGTVTIFCHQVSFNAHSYSAAGAVNILLCLIGSGKLLEKLLLKACWLVSHLQLADVCPHGKSL